MAKDETERKAYYLENTILRKNVRKVKRKNNKKYKLREKECPDCEGISKRKLKDTFN